MELINQEELVIDKPMELQQLQADMAVVALAQEEIIMSILDNGMRILVVVERQVL